jgi:phosphoadenosine phosphosulfate reductase
MSTIPSANINAILTKASTDDVLANLLQLATLHPSTTIFSTSFSEEDQIISHFIFANALPIKVFTLDTGRLFPETYATWNSTLAKYNTPIAAYNPNGQALETMITAKGPNSFYESIENRKDCCHIRKVVPLQRALAGNEVWITGIRAAHSPERKDMPMVEWDDSNQIIKYHPLLHWSHEAVKNFITSNQIPYNPLHDKGFVSIGCAPCTRAIKPGEDFRAGRWWWEDSGSQKECGLHVASHNAQH